MRYVVVIIDRTHADLKKLRPGRCFVGWHNERSIFQLYSKLGLESLHVRPLLCGEFHLARLGGERRAVPYVFYVVAYGWGKKLARL